jgi:hypothetical protein
VCTPSLSLALRQGNTFPHTKSWGEVVSTILSDWTVAARLLPKSHRLLLNPKVVLPGVGEKLAPPWFGGESPLHGAPQLQPFAGGYPSWKELGILIHLPGLSGPVKRPHLSNYCGTCRALEWTKKTRTKYTKRMEQRTRTSGEESLENS